MRFARVLPTDLCFLAQVIATLFPCTHRINNRYNNGEIRGVWVGEGWAQMTIIKSSYNTLRQPQVIGTQILLPDQASQSQLYNPIAANSHHILLTTTCWVILIFKYEMASNKENSSLAMAKGFLAQVISQAASPLISSYTSRSPLHPKQAKPTKSGQKNIRAKQLNSQIDILNQISTYKNQISLFSFHQKVELAKGIITILKNVLRQSNQNQAQTSVAEYLIHNTVVYLAWLKEPILLNLYGYHLIEYLNTSNSSAFTQSCQAIISSMNHISAEDQYSLIYSSFPEAYSFQHSNTNTKTLNLLINDLCVSMILKSNQNKLYTDFLIKLLALKCYSHMAIITNTLYKRLSKMPSPGSRVCEIIDICMESPCDNLKQFIYNIILKLMNEKISKKGNISKKEILEIVSKCILLIETYPRCKGCEKVMNMIFKMAIQFQLLEAISTITHQWNLHNDHVIYHLSCLYSCCNVAEMDVRVLLRITGVVQKLERVELVDYQYVMFEILSKLEVIVRNKISQFSKWSKVKRLLGQSTNSESQFAITGYSNMIRLLKITMKLISSAEERQNNSESDSKERDRRCQQNRHNNEIMSSLLFDTSYVILVETLCLIHQTESPLPQFQATAQKFNFLITHCPPKKLSSAIKILLMMAFNTISSRQYSSKKLNYLKKIINLFFESQQLQKPGMWNLSDCMSEVLVILRQEEAEEKPYIISKLINYTSSNINNEGMEEILGNVIASLLVCTKQKITSTSKLILNFQQSIYSLPSRVEEYVTFFLQDEIIHFMKQMTKEEDSPIKINYLLDIFHELFSIYRQFMLKRFESNLQKYYTRFYETVSLLISFMRKISFYLGKNQWSVEGIEDRIQQLNTSLVMENKHSPYDTFLEMEEQGFEEEDFPHYVNVFAKQVHLLATNVGVKSSFSSWECEYQQLCMKSAQIIKKIKKLEKYLRTLNNRKYRVGTSSNSLIRFGEISLDSQFTLHQLRCLMINLETIIYYCQQLIPQLLPTLISIKLSITVYFDTHKNYESLSLDSKLRVISQLLPLIRTDKEFEEWSRNQIFRSITISSNANSDTLQLYNILKIYLIDPSKIDQKYFEDYREESLNSHKIKLLKFYTWDHNSISISEETLKNLLVMMINTSNGAFQEAIKLNMLKVHKSTELRLPKEVTHSKVSNITLQQFSIYILPVSEMFNFDRITSHMFSTHILRLLSLIIRKNQTSLIKQINEIGSKILLKSFNLKATLGLVEYTHNKLDIGRVFDSTVHIFKELECIKMNKLNSIRENLFNRRKSRSSKYTIDTLTKNLKEIFASNANDNHFSLPLFESFMTVLIKHFGKENHVESYIVSSKISQVIRSKDYENQLASKIRYHFEGTGPISQDEIKQLKSILFGLYYKEINFNYRKAMEYRHMLGKLHSYCNNNLLDENQLILLAFNSTQFNCVYKERMLGESFRGYYLNEMQKTYQMIRENDRDYLIQPVGKKLPIMIKMIQKVQYPFVLVYSFGDQIVTVIITAKIEVLYTDRNTFMDYYNGVQGIIKECNVRENAQVVEINSTKAWWENRTRMDKRMEALVRSMGKIKEINFLRHLYGEREAEAGIAKQDEDTKDTNSIYPNANSSEEYVPSTPCKSEIILILEECLQNFPYEYMMDGAETTKGVYRIPSMGYFFKAARKPRRIVNMSNLSYLVNPENNLELTQKRFLSMKKQMTTWNGIVGKVPSQGQFLGLLDREVFMYMGHGDGRYSSDKELFEKSPKTVPLLYGCSSARMVEQQGSEARGFCLTYLLSGCPLLLGCLWSITDKDIDDFTDRMIRALKENVMDLGHIVAWSRHQCKMKYLNGGAIILYGLPHLFTYRESQIQ